MTSVSASGEAAPVPWISAMVWNSALGSGSGFSIGVAGRADGRAAALLAVKSACCCWPCCRGSRCGRSTCALAVAGAGAGAGLSRWRRAPADEVDDLAQGRAGAAAAIEMGGVPCDQGDLAAPAGHRRWCRRCCAGMSGRGGVGAEGLADEEVSRRVGSCRSGLWVLLALNSAARALYCVE